MQKRRVPDKGILLSALWICVCSAHGLQESEQRVFLRGGQKRPSIQEAALIVCQREMLLPICKKLRERQTEGVADLFQRRKRRRHALFIPRGNGRLRQPRALGKLIFGLAACLAVLTNHRENICHTTATYDISFLIL